jgi:hypothetical protein
MKKVGRLLFFPGVLHGQNPVVLPASGVAEWKWFFEWTAVRKAEGDLDESHVDLFNMRSMF